MKNESLVKLSDETRAALITAIASKAVEALIATTKEATDNDSGTFTVIVSTADRDRQNEIVMQDGWDLAFYKLNPVVLWAHDYSSLPIGVCTSIGVIDGKLQASGKFAPASANPFAQQVRMLYDLGMIKTTSVGFIPTEYDPNDRDVVIKAQMLEFSFVPVPANPYALSLDQAKIFDLGLLKTKGIEIQTTAKKEAGAGDACQLDDGTPGILAKDPNNESGPMVCIPAKAMSHKEAVEKAMDSLNKCVEAFKSNHVKAHKDHQENHMKCVNTLSDAVKDAYVQDSTKAVTEKTADCFKTAFDSHRKSVEAENTRYQAEMETHHTSVKDGIDCLCETVKEAMKMYPSSDETGDDAGANPTADSVRMMKTLVEAFGHIKSAHDALKDYAESEGVKTVVTDDTTTPAEKVESSKTDAAISEVDSFLRNRELLKILNVATGKILGNLNKNSR